MNNNHKSISKILGNLDIFVVHNEDEFEGEIYRWEEILIHGDPNGLKSLANLLIDIANLNQENAEDIPIGAREHIKLRPGLELSSSSSEVIIGRLDANKTGQFYDRFIPKKN